MDYKFIERKESITRADGSVEEVITLNLEKSWTVDGIAHAVENPATPEDEIEYAAEFDAFKKGVDEAGFQVFVESKEDELRAEFLASKASPEFKDEFSAKGEA